jgi:hypothetical protein
MKNLLACLMCLVLTASQCFALAGGPVFTTLDPTGTYAGSIRARKKHHLVFVPPCSRNSLGVFAITIDASGTGTGAFVMFTQGLVFTGNIAGVANLVSGKLTGVLDGTDARGHLQAKITDVQLKGGTIMATRLLGSAFLSVDQGDPLSPTCEMGGLRVNGFKQ